MKHKNLACVGLLFAATCCLLASGCNAPGPGTRQDREGLFRYIVEKTMLRTAWSPYTPGRPEQNFTSDAEKLLPEFLDADTDGKLFLALVKLSNLRHDRHLSVELVDGGIRPAQSELHAPVRFRTDYGTPGRYTLFVADYGEAMGTPTETAGPRVGDELVSVNGIPIDRYASMMEPYIRYSTQNKLWWEIAAAISKKSWEYGPELYGPGDSVSYGLRRGDGTENALEVPFVEPGQIAWAGTSAKHYRGFARLLETPTFDLHRPEQDGPPRVLLLDWKRFERSLPADVDRLMAYASEHGLLDCGVIFDGTTSGGGSRGAYALARLVVRPFKTTFGNLRISDITEAFIDDVRRERAHGGVGEAGDGGRRLLEWLENDVMRAVRDAKPYSPDVPFKLAELPKDSDGIMQPAPVHFRGGLVCMFGPHGGSHLDQFAAMVIDNDLGHTIGLPAGGYSNTWEWTETLRFARTGAAVASYMWNIGHTLRPTGEILEGNPALPREIVPVTRDNFSKYYDDVLRRALAHLEEPRGSSGAARGGSR